MNHENLVREKAEALNAIIIPTLRERIKTLGEDEAGAYNFYGVRAERGDVFADYDLLLAARLISDPDFPGVVHEVGGGYGNFSWLMAALGSRAVCLESDGRRFNGGLALWEAFLTKNKKLKNNYEMRRERFPAEGLEPEGWVVITNLIATTTEDQQAAMIAALSRYPSAVIDIDRFVDYANTPEERAAKIERFTHAGLTVTPYLDVGKSAYFCRISPKA